MRLISMLLLAMVITTSLAACGRKGPLDRPFDAQVEARREAEEAGTQPLPPEPSEPPEDRRFILDGLID